MNPTDTGPRPAAAPPKPDALTWFVFAVVIAVLSFVAVTMHWATDAQMDYVKPKPM